MNSRQEDATAPAESGAAVAEVLMAVLVAGVLASLSAPLSATVVDAGKARHAAGFIAARLRMAQIESVSRGVTTGAIFDFAGGRWQIRLCRDGTANGLRRAEIASGADPCFEGPYVLSDMFPDVSIDVDSRLIGPGGEPGNPDPVRFGVSDTASFTPLGTATPGSVFLRTRRGQQYAIRVAGATGRIRVLRWESGAAIWRVP